MNTGIRLRCSARDLEVQFPSYDIPVACWQNLKIINPIVSIFVTIRPRLAKIRICLSEKTALSLVYQLAMVSRRRWSHLRDFCLLACVVAGVTFFDEVDEIEMSRETV